MTKHFCDMCGVELANPNAFMITSSGSRVEKESKQFCKHCFNGVMAYIDDMSNAYKDDSPEPLDMTNYEGNLLRKNKETGEWEKVLKD